MSSVSQGEICIIDPILHTDKKSTELIHDIKKLKYDIYCKELELYPENTINEIEDDYDSIYVVYIQDDEVRGFVSITKPESSKKSITKYVSADIVEALGAFFEIRSLSVVSKYRNNGLVSKLMANAFLYCVKYCPCNIVAMLRSELLSVYKRHIPFEKMANDITIGKLTMIPHKCFLTKTELLSSVLRMDRNISIGSDVCPHGLGKSSQVKYPLDVLDAQYINESRVLLNVHSPDSSYRDLRTSIGSLYKVDKDEVIMGCGSSQLIFSGLQSVFTKYDKVSILSPTYEEYEYVLENIVNCRVNKINILENHENLEQYISDSVIISGSTGLCIVSPNSPIPLTIDIHKLHRLLPKDIILWVDETYYPFYNYLKNKTAEFSYETPKLLSERNIVLCRSMSKIYALSGMRIGYCLANKNIINLIKRQIPPWSINSYAVEEALKIHNDNQSITAYYNEQLKQLLSSKETFCNGIRDIVEIINEENSINYIFFYSDIENLNEILLENGVKIRTYRGLDKYYRIAVPNISAVDTVIKAFLCCAT